MIFSLQKKDIPNHIHQINNKTFCDRDCNKWNVILCNNGFIIQFIGPDFFIPKILGPMNVGNSEICIKNTNIFLLKHPMRAENEVYLVFAEIRDSILKLGTNDFWKWITNRFTERFKQNPKILKCEHLNKKL